MNVGYSEITGWRQRCRHDQVVDTEEFRIVARSCLEPCPNDGVGRADRAKAEVGDGGAVVVIPICVGVDNDRPGCAAIGRILDDVIIAALEISRSLSR